MPHLKKATPGSDSFGNEWPVAGAIVEVTPEQAAALLAIQDAGFTEVAPPAVVEDESEPDGAPEEPDDKEPAADAEPADEAAKPAPRRGGRKPRAAAEPSLIEE